MSECATRTTDVGNHVCVQQQTAQRHQDIGVRRSGLLVMSETLVRRTISMVARSRNTGSVITSPRTASVASRRGSKCSQGNAGLETSEGEARVKKQAKKDVQASGNDVRRRTKAESKQDSQRPNEPETSIKWTQENRIAE